VSYPLGVDVGTTYTAAALWRDGRVQTVPLGNRSHAVPSVVYLREDGTLLVGEAAVRRGIAEPGRAAREFKRRLGDDVPLLLGGRSFAAHELTGHVLRWVVDRVSELQGGPPGHIVLTYPAEWGGYRRGLYLEAARTAGFGQVGLLAEPVAAATANPAAMTRSVASTSTMPYSGTSANPLASTSAVSTSATRP
jgi:molecular chaperone DnaK